MGGREPDSEATGDPSSGHDVMPAFSISAYRDVLVGLQRSGFECHPVSAMRDSEPRSAYIRHDIDFFLAPALPMARCEAELGIAATYYVLLTGFYNPRSAANVSVLRNLIALGHEIGLHYDLETYPSDPPGARRRLEAEVALLEDLCGQPVTTISMHQPGLAHGDPFASNDRWTHPHDPRLQTGLLYVSDSCRSWRDTTLLQCFGPEPPERLLWLTHPELYLDGSIVDRERYLDEVLAPAASGSLLGYFDSEVRKLWLESEAARLHDARLGASKSDRHD